jgi:hypothetical protein
MTNQEIAELTPAPLPDPVALLDRARTCRGRLHSTKSASVLRNLRSVDEEKVLLASDHLPTGYEGMGRPGGPVPGDRYSAMIRPALVALDAVANHEAAIAEAEQVSAEIGGAFDTMDTALRGAEGGGDALLDPGRVHQLTALRRQFDGVRLEHIALLEDLVDARLYVRSFITKAERLRDAAVMVIHEQIVQDVRAALDSHRQRVAALCATAIEGLDPVRTLVGKWIERGQPVRLPRITWPATGDPFAPPTLMEPKA